MTARYALYYAPEPAHPLWRAGCDWVGRDAETGACTEAAAQKDHLTAVPRRYGFHATMKAPFALTPGITVQDLSGALVRYARAQRAFEVPPLKVARLDDFLALVPCAPEPRLTQIEREVVTQFDAFRAALTDAELAQRRRARLDSVEEELLLRFGYPYVLQRFRFHLSLTGSLAGIDEDIRIRVAADARKHFEPALSVPLAFDALCVFEEPECGADFRLLNRVSFGAN